MALFSQTAHSQSATPLTSPSAKPLIAVVAPEKVDADWRSNICALLPKPCENESLELFTHKNPSGTAYVVLASSPLVMAEIDRSNNQWRLSNLLDFRGYRHSAAVPKDAINNVRLTIAPALYPLGPNQWAAALLFTIDETYSGGGAHFTTADFVAAQGTNLGKSKPLQAGIPFSCTRMVRACFKEKEYETSPHCHDETEGSLRISYGLASNSVAPYRWEYLWRETKWPAHKKKSSIKTSSTKFTDSTLGSVPMCGGPQ